MKRKLLPIMKYVLLAFLVFLTSTVASVLTQAILESGTMPWSAFTNDHVDWIAGLIEGVVASVGAALVFYQLKTGNKAEKQQSKIDEANFILQYNQAFIQDENMTKVEHLLECVSKEHDDLQDIISDDNIQKFVNYLVYLEGLAPLILQDIVSLDTVDDLFAYRFFLAMNNPVLQKNELFVYPDYYRGCFKLYRKWKEYREKKGLPILCVKNALDEWLYFDVYANSDLIIRPMREDDNKKKIAALIYQTDPFIYPALFGLSRFSSIYAKRKLPLMMKENSIFTSENILVAESNDKIVGVAVVLEEKNSINCKCVSEYAIGEAGKDVCDKYFNKIKHHIYDDESYILCFCVDQKERGKGIGKAMLGSIIRACKHNKMRLHVLEKNENAIELYSKYGFNKSSNIPEDGYAYIGKNKREKTPKCYEMVIDKAHEI